MEQLIFNSQTDEQQQEAIKRALASFFAENKLFLQAAAVHDENVYGIQGLADYLHCGLNAAQKKKSSGRLKFYQDGGIIYFKKSEIDASLSSDALKKKEKIILNCHKTNSTCITKPDSCGPGQSQYLRIKKCW